MKAASPKHSRPTWLVHATLLTLLTFGVQACGAWRTVPLANIDSGQESLDHVEIRVKERGSSEKRTVTVVSVQFPFVDGTEKTPAGPDGTQGREARNVRIDLRNSEEIEVYDANTGLTILAVFGVAAAVVAVVALIAALTKSSCPFVYAVTPDGPVLVGEAYSGATGRSTQRADLMPVPPLTGGRARFLLANEARETQYTDQLELWLVDHAPGLRAVATADARTVLVEGALAPTRVTDLGGADVTSLVAVQDGRFWQSDLDRLATEPAPELREGLEATFDAPIADARQVLELQVGNTAWMDLVFGRFFALMGESLDAHVAGSNDPASGPSIRAWRQREGVDLSLEVLRSGRWERVGLVSPVGPMAPRHVALPLPRGEASAPLRVRLTGGLGFWRFDQIALSVLRTDEPPSVRLAPVSARQGDGSDVRALLAAPDGRYQVLRHTGERVDLTFEPPAVAPGAVREAFLFTSGYYNVYEPPQSERSLATLYTLRDEPGSLSRFSLDLYRKYRELALATPAEGAR
jgi:hypothetical protein